MAFPSALSGTTSKKAHRTQQTGRPCLVVQPLSQFILLGAPHTVHCYGLSSHVVRARVQALGCRPSTDLSSGKFWADRVRFQLMLYCLCSALLEGKRRAVNAELRCAVQASKHAMTDAITSEVPSTRTRGRLDGFCAYAGSL